MRSSWWMGRCVVAGLIVALSATASTRADDEKTEKKDESKKKPRTADVVYVATPHQFHAGHVQLAALSVASGMPQIKAGKVRGLVVTSTKRSPALPDVPTVAEAGFPGFEAVGWLGILVPNGTPPAVIARLHAEFGKVMQNPDVQKALIAQGVEAYTGGTSEAFGAMIKSETAKWHKIVRDAGIKPE